MAKALVWDCPVSVLAKLIAIATMQSHHDWDDSEALVDAFLSTMSPLPDPMATTTTTANATTTPSPAIASNNNGTGSEIHDAIVTSDIDFLRHLLAAKADPNEEVQGFTPLHLAVGSGNNTGSVKAAEALLDAKADMYRHACGQTPCHLAARCGNTKLVALFLGEGFSLHNRVSE